MRDVVRVSGPDAATFLQGQLSQDVVALNPSAWSFLLQPQGKVEVLLRITRESDDSFLLDTDAGWGARMVERLERFKLRVKAEIAVVNEPHALEVAPWPGSELRHTLVDTPDEAARVEAGFPAMGSEVDDRTIPGETGLVPFAVSFTKGCYTGQELVARIDSRGGNVPRHLRHVRGDAVAVGQPLVVGGKEVGSLTSVAGGLGLAYVRREVDVPASTDDGLEIVKLPFE